MLLTRPNGMEHAAPILWGQPQDPKRQQSGIEESLYTKDLGPWPWASPFPSPGLTVLSNTKELEVWASPSTTLQDHFIPVALFTPIHLSNPWLL